ncbi:MAG: MFS transporter [Chloroflexi bacterium]|nr:MAG: MFS transporter [Chloroflexota bacterium]
MSARVTDVEKIRRIPWLIAADSLNTGFFLLTFSGSVFVLFLNELGLDEGQIGFLLSLIPFAGIISPFIAPQTARFGYKRTFVTFWGLRNAVFAMMLLTPLVIARYGPQTAFLWVSAIIFVFALCRAIAETGGYPWRKEAVPDSIRGKFTALSSMSTTVSGITVTALASYIIDTGTGLGRFLLLMTIGITFGVISVWAYSHVPGGAAPRVVDQGRRHFRQMGRALRDRNFLFFLMALGLATIGSASVISFIPLFMKEQVGLSEGHVVLLSIGTYLGALISSYWWGWVADRYGSQPVMQFSLSLMLVLPTAWFLMPRHSTYSLPIAMTIAFVMGITNLAWQISWIRYLYVNAIRPRYASAYTAVYYAWFGLVNGSAPLLAGQILRLSRGLEAEVWRFHIDPYTPLFGLSIILLATAASVVSQLTTTDATPFRRLAGMFLRGNPIRALESVVQYSFAASEDSRMATTERMGDAANPLSTYELIEALNDPSFNVRYEAIHAIGRMPPEPELVDALLDQLKQGKSELSFVVTRSLGRLGDRRAIPPLREMLHCGYHLLEANAARALSMLEDVESVPVLREKFRREPNEILRIAYASALGRLHDGEAVDEIFDLLLRVSNEVLRGEVGLALARIAGPENYYMQWWRTLRTNPETAAAQAVLGLRKPLDTRSQPEVEALIETCADHLARGQTGEGAALLRQIAAQLPPDLPSPEQAAILRRCDAALAEFDGTRWEILLLTLHTLDCALRQSFPPALADGEWFQGADR